MPPELKLDLWRAVISAAVIVIGAIALLVKSKIEDICERLNENREGNVNRDDERHELLDRAKDIQARLDKFDDGQSKDRRTLPRL